MEYKRLIAIIGAVAALVGGSVAVGVDYFLGERARVASELSARRAEAYLDFLSTRNRLHDIVRTLRMVADGHHEPMSKFCFEALWQPERVEALRNKPELTKTRAAKTCEEYFAVHQRLVRSRDILTIFGSDSVLKSVASNDRAVRRDESGLCSYLDMIVQMRRDNTDHSDASTTNDDLLAVICAGQEVCFGSEVPSSGACQ